MDDLISRQDAIDAICMEWCNVKHQDCKHEQDDYYWCDGCETVLKTLVELPVAQPKHGRWEDCSNGWMCSVCKHDARKDYPYCPNCGAYMMDEASE